MKRRQTRVRVRMECTVCGSRNYTASKNKTTMPEKLVLKKYCSTCAKHTPHTEGK